MVIVGKGVLFKIGCFVKLTPSIYVHIIMNESMIYMGLFEGQRSTTWVFNDNSCGC